MKQTIVEKKKEAVYGCYYHKEEDITKEIRKIIKYCRARDCDDCKYFSGFRLCDIHNPSGWNV